MVKAKANEIQYMHFTVFDTDGTTPLTGQAGSCTSSLRKNGATTAESVSIGEIGSTGRYYASFTPLVEADYDLEVLCPDDRVMGENWETEVADLDDIKAETATINGNVDVAVSTRAPANEYDTQLDQNLSTTESNIRGGDNDDLKDISDEIALIEGITESDFHDYQDSYANKDGYMADVSLLALEATVQEILSDTETMEADLKTYMDFIEDNIRGADDDDLKDISDQIDSIDIELDDVQRILGLVHENHYIDQTEFENDNMTSGRIRIYSNAGSVGTDNDVIATYTLTATYTGIYLTTYKVVKE